MQSNTISKVVLDKTPWSAGDPENSQTLALYQAYVQTLVRQQYQYVPRIYNVTANIISMEKINGVSLLHF